MERSEAKKKRRKLTMAAGLKKFMDFVINRGTPVRGNVDEQTSKGEESSREEDEVSEEYPTPREEGNEILEDRLNDDDNGREPVVKPKSGKIIKLQDGPAGVTRSRIGMTGQSISQMLQIVKPKRIARTNSTNQTVMASIIIDNQRVRYIPWKTMDLGGLEGDSKWIQ